MPNGDKDQPASGQTRNPRVQMGMRRAAPPQPTANANANPAPVTPTTPTGRPTIPISPTRRPPPPPPGTAAPGAADPVVQWGSRLAGALGGAAAAPASSDRTQPPRQAPAQQAQPQQAPAQQSQPQQGQPQISPRANKAANPDRGARNIGGTELLDMFRSEPKMIKEVSLPTLERAYLALDPAGRQELFGHMSEVPDHLAKLIEADQEAGAELRRKVIAARDPALASAVLAGVSASTKSANTFVDDMIADPASDRAAVRAIAIKSGVDIINEATDPGTAGRSNSGRTNMLSKMGKTGPAKRNIDDALAGTVGLLDTMRVPTNVSIKSHELKDVPEAARQLAIEQTVAAVATVLRKIVADLTAKPLTPDITMVTASIYDAAKARFDDKEAARIAGGHVFLRIITPAILPGLTKVTLPQSQKTATPQQTRLLTYVSKVLQNVANDIPFTGGKEPEAIVLQPLFDEIQQTIQAFVAEAVDAGRHYLALETAAAGLDVADPRQVVQAARGDPALAARLFAPADANYPYGTRPLDARSDLGKALDLAARGRDRDVDLAAAKALPDYARVVADERFEVLNAARV